MNRQRLFVRLRLVSQAAALALLAIVLAAPAASAAPCGKGPKPIGAVNSSNGGVYDEGSFGIILKHVTFDQDQWYHGGDKQDFLRPKKGQKPGKKCAQRSVAKSQLVLRAGIAENIDTRLVIPYVSKDMERQSCKQDFDDHNSGIGDVKLIARYRILAQKHKDPFNLACGLGVQMPSGKTDERDDYGKFLPGFLQSGTGSWDPILELGAHKVSGRNWFSGNLMYRITGKGEQGTTNAEKPDVFKYDLAYGYALSRLFDLGLEINGHVNGKARLDGEKVANTGGHTVFVTPGVHFKFHRGMHLDVGVPIVVYRHLTGHQLGEDYRLVTKLAMKF